MDDVVIKVDNLWKRYGLPLPGFVRKGQGWLKRNLSSHARRSASRPELEKESHFALKDFSLEVKRGQTLGIIGHNGAGKSTLLKILAGVTLPTSGRVEILGRVFPMIELNAGIHPEFTGRENVRILGAIMGLSQAEIEAKVSEIEEFCELQEWFDKPVRMYSSGMLARLGFGVAVEVESDILLVDEVLAVGDISFQRKCLRRIHQYAANGGTVLLVSHWLDMVRSVCKEGVYLDRGSIVRQGDIQAVIIDYVDAMHREDKRQSAAQSQADPKTKDTGIRITKVEVLLENSEQPTNEVVSGEDMTVRLHYTASQRIENASFGLSVWTANGVRLSTVNTLFAGLRIEHLEGTGYCDCRLIKLPLLPGVYFMRVGVYDALTTWPYHRIGWDDNPIELVVKGSMKLSKNIALTPDHGIVQLQTSWSLC
jgi:ABC-type polysaccharide/polyol phosphate transport system ATPase subunit